MSGPRRDDAEARAPGLWRALLSFVRHPQPDAEEGASWGFKLKRTLALIGFDLLFTLLLMAFAGALGGLGHGVKHTRDFGGESLAYTVFMFVLAVPLVEELIFRAPLRTLHPLPAAFSAGMLLALFVSPRGLEWAGFLLGGAVVGLSWHELRRTGRWGLAQARWRKHFPWLVHGSATLFALAHANNYGSGTSVLVMIVLLAPRYVAGLLMAFARVRYGIGWGWLLHGGFNAVLLTIGALVR